VDEELDVINQQGICKKRYVHRNPRRGRRGGKGVNRKEDEKPTYRRGIGKNRVLLARSKREIKSRGLWKKKGEGGGGGMGRK